MAALVCGAGLNDSMLSHPPTYRPARISPSLDGPDDDTFFKNAHVAAVLVQPITITIVVLQVV